MRLSLFLIIIFFATAKDLPNPKSSEEQEADLNKIMVLTYVVASVLTSFTVSCCCGPNMGLRTLITQLLMIAWIMGLHAFLVGFLMIALFMNPWF